MLKSLIYGIAALALLPVAAAAEVNVTYSDDFAEELTDNYGEKEGVYLTKEIQEDLTAAFAKTGVNPIRVDVVIIDAKPNRPTFEQMSSRPGLDPFRSRSIGGMELQATAYDADGAVIGSHEYGWFENDIRDVVGSSTWTDAKRASNRFSRKFAQSLSN